MKVAVYTLGCRLNQSESESILDSFLRNGFEKGELYESDIVIVNTCTVTSKAEQKARRVVRKLEKSASLIIVTGCYVEVSEEEVDGLSSKIVSFSLDEKGDILSLPLFLKGCGKEELLEKARSFPKVITSRFAFDSNTFSYHSRAYLKVQDGCDNECGYCKTTIARGKSIFLPVDEAVKRALELEDMGFHEIVLTGVNLSNYDHSGGGLSTLLEALLSSLSSSMRIRFSSLEADGIDDRLLSLIGDERIFPHFHLPLQSASQKVLSYVGRNYSMDHLRYVIDVLRRIKGDPFIASDVIAGLPGESDEDFAETVDFVRKYDISTLHVFPYSPREGTKLYGDRNRVPERVRDERAGILRKISDENYKKYVSRWLGKSVEAIVERKGDGVMYGTSGNYLKVVIDSKDERKRGELVSGTLTSLNPLVLSV